MHDLEFFKKLQTEITNLLLFFFFQKKNINTIVHIRELAFCYSGPNSKNLSMLKTFLKNKDYLNAIVES